LRSEDRAAAAGVTLSGRAFVFSPAADGMRPWCPNEISLSFGRLRKKAGVRSVRLHRLRHFAATQMLAAGVPVRTVSGRLGHADAATTLNIYGHWVLASDQAAATILGDLLGSQDQPGDGRPDKGS